MITTTFEFYQALAERWKQLFSLSPKQSSSDLKEDGIPRLTTLAKNAILSHPLSIQKLPSQPHSLIKKILPNGFTIFIENRSNPKATVPVASMRLVVKAGHLHEEEKEIGLAHLVEHGIFQGTKSFTWKEIESLFKSLGCRPGADSNARTNYESTVYQLDNIPLKEQEKWEKCIQLFYEFCTCVTFPKTNMLKERDVVEDENLKRQGASNDSFLHRYSCCFPNNRYVERFPGRLSEQIRGATEDELHFFLQSFYQKWYQPHNMALVIVGDFDNFSFARKNSQKLVEEIENLFGQIPSSLAVTDELDSSLDKRLRVIAPWKQEVRISTFSHPNFSLDTIQFCTRMKWIAESDFISTRTHLLVVNIFENFLHQYLIKLKKQNGSPLCSWNRTQDKIEFSDSALNLFQINAIHGFAQEALRLVVREFKKLELYGCDEVRLDAFFKSYRQSCLARIMRHPINLFSTVVENYVSAFIKESFPTTQAHDVCELFLLDQLDKKELNQRVMERAKLLTPYQDQDVSLVLYSSSDKEEAAFKSERLKSVLEDPTLYENIESAESLIAEDNWLTQLKDNLVPTPATGREHFASINTYAWRFPNQIEVFYKPMTSLESSLKIEFIVPNGIVHMPSRHQTLHILMGVMVLNSIGLKDKSYSELDVIKLNATINQMIIMQYPDYWKISFNLKDSNGLESALQILHLRLTDMAPILSEEFAQCWKAVLAQYKSNLKKTLQTENGKRIHAESFLRFEDHPLLKITSPEEIDGLKLEEAQRILLEFLPRFSQARLLICGSNEEPDMISDLAEKYIGSLCPLASKEKGSFLPVNFTPGYKIELKEGTVPNRSSYSFYFSFKKGLDPEIETKLAIAQDFVHFHMNQKIRKEQQLIYGIQFRTQRFSLASDWNFAQLSFQCETSKADALIKQIWNALNGILDLTEAELIDYLEKKKTEWRRVLANQIHDITYWSNTLINYLEKDYSLHFISNRKNWYDNMTVFELKKMLHSLLERREEFKQIVLHPKIEPLKQALQAVSSS